MSRIVDVICSEEDYQTAVQHSKFLVEQHLVVVSYVIPAKLFINHNDSVIESDTTLLILKSKDTVVKDKLIPQIKSLTCNNAIMLPIVDVVPDYRKWVEDEVYE